jgi:hypothetical protein
MLSQEERQRLEEIERQLAADDPRFVARMRSARRRPDGGTVVLLALWAAALVMAVMTRSTLMIVALGIIVAIEVGWRLYRRRHPIQAIRPSP